MNRIHTALAITGLCITAVGWQVWQQTDAEFSLADSQDIDATSTGPTTPDSNTPIGLTDPPATQLTIEPMTGGAGLVQKVADNPRCHVSAQFPDPDTGELVDAYSCTSVRPDPHPYETWSEGVLAGMAYGDAKAAEVLGLRHITSEDPNREALGLMLLYRSVALSGSTESLHLAASRRYTYAYADGKPQIGNLKQLLLFGIIAQRLGDTGIDPRLVEARLKKESISPEAISRVRASAESILEQMAVIQTEITGKTSISEVLSNA